MEPIDFMAGVGGTFVSYHAVRLFVLMCFRISAAFREWLYQRPSQRALRRADLAIDRADCLDKWTTRRHAEFEARLQALEDTKSPTARIAILDEQVADLLDLSLAQTSHKHSLSKGVKLFLDKYDEKGDKKKDLPN